MTEARLTASEWAAMMHDPLKDRSYRTSTAAGPYVEPFLATKRFEERSDRYLDEIERTLAKMCLAYPDKELGQFSSNDLLAFLTSYPAGSRRVRRSHIAEFWQWAAIWEHITDEEGHNRPNPMWRIPKIPKPHRRVVEIFSDAHEQSLCSLPELRDRSLHLILFGTGVRLSEATHIQRRHFGELADRTLRVVAEGAKGSKERLVPLPPRVTQAVADLEIFDGLAPDDFLWYLTRANQYRREGKIVRDTPMTNNAFYVWWRRTLNDADVPYVPRNLADGIKGLHNPHVTRHTYATKYLRAGGRIEKLSRILGHADVSTTDRHYSHMNVADLAEDAEMVMVARGWSQDPPSERVDSYSESE